VIEDEARARIAAHRPGLRFEKQQLLLDTGAGNLRRYASIAASASPPRSLAASSRIARSPASSSRHDEATGGSDGAIDATGGVGGRVEIA
jgi:hypothetical protein